MKRFLTEDRLQALLDGAKRVRIGVLGDFCMDIYWHADMTLSRLSRETPHFPLPVVSERMSPGAAGNVAANIAALGPEKLVVFGAVGRDWRGALLTGALEALGAQVRFVECAGRMTNAYIKPMMKGTSDVVYEAPRLDFENDRPLSAEAEDELIAKLCSAAKDLDVLCVCDQMVNGCVTQRVRGCVEELARCGLTVIADSREQIGLFKNVIVKPNDIEAAYALGDEAIAPDEAAVRLHVRSGRPVIVTAGEAGCWLCEGCGATRIPAVRVDGPVDICGAGDTFLSALACALGSGAGAAEAAALGNLASSVTIRKIGTTGTASPAELFKAYREAE